MRKHTQKAIGALAILFAAAFAPSAHADLFMLTNVSSDPNIFECDLTAVESDVTIDGSTVHIFTYKDEAPAAAVPPMSAGIPIQVIKVKVGDTIICRFKNKLSVDDASIHWHGIELDNDSDGTAVTQDVVKPDQSYTYQFQTFRPGIFWFHSHMLPGNTLFGGMYGVLIIENNIEPSLIAAGTLPAEADTFTLALSDIKFDPATGTVGKQIAGAGLYYTENELIESCHLWGVDGTGDMKACKASQDPGSTVLVNGVSPDAVAETPKFTVPSGKRVRLRLLNESISRHFKLKLLDSGNNTLYRIGGQGGLLDNIVVEGGTMGTWDTKYSPGEILIGSGMRADVIIYPTGSEGTIIRLVGNPTTDSYQISTGLPTDYPIAYFQISGSATDSAPAAGDPILEGTAEDIENIKSGLAITALESPAPDGGSDDETIRLTTDAPTGPPVAFANTQPGIDQFAAPLDTNMGDGDWLLVTRPPVARYAHVGDVLELIVRNETAAAHPYHLHGFSMQPVRMTDNTGNVLYEFDYDEFVDTVDVQGNQSFVFRTRIDDRPKICDKSPDLPPNDGPVLAECADAPCGGVVGRWLFHCHIVGHGALGMIGEVTVLPDVDNPPEITSSLAVTKLMSVNHDLVNVGLSATVTDDCPYGLTSSVAVFGDEDDELPTGDGTHSPDANNIAIDTLRLRAERVGRKDGRVYLIIITATDSAGNKATACHTVVVPRDLTVKSLASVNLQAKAARDFCTANGTPPPSFVVVGDGIVIGPKQ